MIDGITKPTAAPKELEAEPKVVANVLYSIGNQLAATFEGAFKRKGCPTAEIIFPNKTQ